MAEGVAEVQDHALAGFPLVRDDDGSLDRHRGPDNMRQRLRLAGEDRVGIAFEEVEKVLASDDGSLDRLLQTGAQLAGRQCAQQAGIGEHRGWMVEAAEQVLSREEVDAGFAADGTVHLGEQGRGDLDIGDAAYVDGGKKAGDVANDAAAKGDQQRVPVRARLCQLLGQCLHGRETFVRFARRQKQDRWGLRRRECR